MEFQFDHNAVASQEFRLIPEDAILLAVGPEAVLQNVDRIDPS